MQVQSKRSVTFRDGVNPGDDSSSAIAQLSSNCNDVFTSKILDSELDNSISKKVSYVIFLFV